MDNTMVELKPPRKLGRRINRAMNVGSTAPKFNWRCPEGLAAKHVLHQWGLTLAGSEGTLTHTASWAQLGITARGALETVATYLPWFPAFYAEAMGKPLTGERLKDRLFNMFYDRKLGRMGISGEHPLRSPSMSPFNRIAAMLFARGKPLTREQAVHLFSLPAKAVSEALAYLDGEAADPGATSVGE